MSKKKKTLREKRLSDTRRVSSPTPLSVQTQPVMYSVPSITPLKQTSTSSLETMISVPTTIHDLRKSLTISAVILAANIIIYFLIANNLISIRLLGL